MSVQELKKWLDGRLDEVNAVHEAGHAAIAIALGEQVVEVCLSKEHGGFGHSRSRGLRNNPRTALLVGLAGPGAEVIFRKDWPWSNCLKSSGRQDWKNAKPSFDVLAQSSDRPRRSSSSPSPFTSAAHTFAS